jgi:hypothetical protein
MEEELVCDNLSRCKPIVTDICSAASITNADVGVRDRDEFHLRTSFI